MLLNLQENEISSFQTINPYHWSNSHCASMSCTSTSCASMSLLTNHRCFLYCVVFQKISKWQWDLLRQWKNVLTIFYMSRFDSACPSHHPVILYIKFESCPFKVKEGQFLIAIPCSHLIIWPSQVTKIHWFLLQMTYQIWNNIIYSHCLLLTPSVSS